MLDNNLPDAERERFAKLSIPHQIMKLFDMARDVRADIAGVKRIILDLQDDILQYRQVREKRESPITTEQKIQAIMDRRDALKWFVDKVLPSVITAIVIALLYLAFQKP